MRHRGVEYTLEKMVGRVGIEPTTNGLIVTVLLFMFPLQAWRAMGRVSRKVVNLGRPLRFANPYYQARFEALNAIEE